MSTKVVKLSIYGYFLKKITKNKSNYRTFRKMIKMMKFRSNYDKNLKKIGQINLIPETHVYIEGNRYREGISIERVYYNLGQIMTKNYKKWVKLTKPTCIKKIKKEGDRYRGDSFELLKLYCYDKVF